MDQVKQEFLTALASHQVIGLDTSVFIYHFEAHPRYLSLTTAVLTAIERGQVHGIASSIAIMELTVQPWRQNKQAVAREYETILVNFPHLAVVDVTRGIARRAAQFRARYHLRPADALHVASAVHHGATAFVTNDRQLQRLDKELTALIMDDFVL